VGYNVSTVALDVAGRCAEDDQGPVRDENPQPASHRRVRDVDAGAES